MTSTNPQQVLATMSPAMIRALRHVHDGRAHQVHGREISSLRHRGLIADDPYGCITITPLGAEILTLTKETT